MFEASLIESTGRIHARNGRGIAIAVTVQGIVLCALLLIPLLSPARLPQRVLLMTLTTPPAPSPVIPVLKQPATLATPTTSTLDVVRQAFLAPTVIPHGIPDVTNEPDVTAFTATGIGADPNTDVGNLLNTLSSARTSIVRSVVPSTKRGPVRISGGVMQGQLDSPIKPVYPAIALAAHMQGTVVVAATVSRTGAIEKLQVISGPMILRQAAIDAIQRAHYKPFKLSGEAVEVDTTISVVFSLNQLR